MTHLLAAHPPWRRLLAGAGLVSAFVVLAVLAFAWPAARIEPRNVPLGVVGSSASTQQVIEQLSLAQPGAFDYHAYPDASSARAAIAARDVYGALVVDDGRVLVLEASAASPAVAQVLTTLGQHVAGQPRTAEPRAQLSVVDVAPLSRHDPRGLVFSAALLPLTICSVIVAAAVGLVFGLRSAGRQVVALVVLSGLAGLAVFAVAQSFLGALPHDAVATWGALSLIILAIAATGAGVVALVGLPGVGIVAAVMVFVGNPSSGATSAPELLPGAVRDLGQALPPGAGASLLRSTAYFDGSAAVGHVGVLLAWSLLGIAAIVVGHHHPNRFAAGRSAAHAELPVEPGRAPAVEAVPS